MKNEFADRVFDSLDFVIDTKGGAISKSCAP